MRNPDLTTIAPDVLHSIARLAALKVPGVHSTSPRRGAPEGVQIRVADSTVDVDLFLVMDADTNLRQVSRDVQAAVARAVEEMVGMVAGQINIHIEDIYYRPADSKE
ncbi:MAG: Asp23/Gls24 family envelope stress response protein [Chloroflexi bacterium]|nr:Asp23/Gls24 family envelope stress response protein [Chloroflexota bacterium]